MPMTLKIGAAAYNLTVVTDQGKQTYDLSKMNANQLEGVRELVVNWWAREHDMKEPYQE